MKKHYKPRFYFIYTIFLFDKKLNKKTALLLQTTNDIYSMPKYLRIFSGFVASKRLRSMVQYQLGYRDFDILRFSVEKEQV